MTASGSRSRSSRSASAAQDPVPVLVQTRFDRFPTSVKGAFVLQGGDGNPHSVRFAQVSVARLPRGGATPVPMEDRPFDVAPARDLFVPFEAPVTDLEPGWYAVCSTILVDAARTWENRGRPFTIPWPRSDVRRASIPVGRDVDVGGVAVRLMRVDLLPDASVVTWRVPEAADRERGIEVSVRSDGRALDVVPGDANVRLPDLRAPEEGRTISYPTRRDARGLELVVALGSARSEPVSIRLP